MWRIKDGMTGEYLRAVTVGERRVRQILSVAQPAYRHLRAIVTHALPVILGRRLPAERHGVRRAT